MQSRTPWEGVRFAFAAAKEPGERVPIQSDFSPMPMVARGCSISFDTTG
ncbi:hypothetical protein C7451_11078 [Blastomonas natatoria]|uniref:Uncharacterized protein n=1 Tax=Blastomonas natatoria TaxID=34015 RepID=A0A2V3UWV3_9SPHN|nr:hypothetical protein C7451_11078 [Blastomonas natatoria]